MSNCLRENSEILLAAQEYIKAEREFNHVSLTLLSKKYNLKRDVIARKIKELGFEIINRTTGKPFDFTVFDTINTEEKAYWLGFLYADGCVTKNNYVEVGVHENDKAHMSKYVSFLKLKSKDSVKCKNKLARVRIHNYHLSEQLILKGCVQKKSLILKFPCESIFSNKNLIYDFIRGYCDGDGCLRFYVDKTSHCCNVTFVGTLNFLQGISNFLNLPGYIRNASSKNNKTSVYRLSYCNVNARKVARLLYENSNVYMDRKYEIYEQFCRFEEESSRAKSSKISRRWDANTEVNLEIAKGSKSPQRVEGE